MNGCIRWSEYLEPETNVPELTCGNIFNQRELGALVHGFLALQQEMPKRFPRGSRWSLLRTPGSMRKNRYFPHCFTTLSALGTA